MGHGFWGGCCSGLLGGFGGLGLVGSILNLVISAGLIIGVVVLLIWAVRRLRSSNNSVVGQNSQGKSLQSPLDILKLRYASGEITQKEFQDMKTDLK
jgi:putative membrane protein